MLRKTAGVWSETERGSPVEKVERAEPVRRRDLREIVEAIKENFDNAASAGDKVSDMLQISKAQLDRSFKQLRSKFPLFFKFLNTLVFAADALLLSF